VESATDALSNNAFGVARRAAFAVVVIVLSAGATAQQQVLPPSGAPGAVAAPPTTQPTGDMHTAIIRGRVLRADTGRPLASARVTATLAGRGGESAVAISDESGRFELRALRAGRYTVQAARTGYVTFTYGQRRLSEAGRAIEVGVAQTVRDIEIALPGGGVISGTILDEHGEPLVAAPVEVMRPRFVNGVRRLVSAMSSTGEITDDRGQFRIHGLEPGAYYVAAGPASGPLERTYRTRENLATFYPGTDSVAEAQAIRLDAGQEVGGISFTVKPVRLAAIRGTIHRSDGTPGRSLRGSNAYGDGLDTIRVDRDGSFVVLDPVPPGRYHLFAVEDGEVVAASVSVDGADVMVPLFMNKAPTVRGRLIFEGDASRSRPPLSDFGVQARGMASYTMFSNAAIGSDGTFSLMLWPGAQLINVFSARDWQLLSIRRNGEDVTTQASFEAGELSDLEIVFTTRTTTLTGVVHDSRGRVTSDATIVVFPEDARVRETGLSRHIRVVRPDDQGRFTVSGLVPTKYIAIAVEDLERGEETDSQTLQRLANRGVLFEIAAGQTHALNLRVVDAP
jgi:protocatechuate 3,4-dioxygenase beta subunit